jgi:hypothetical protein
MKRLVVSSLAIITLFGFFTLSGNTFFGLSECEKVNEEIQTEESIGYEIWKSFDETRDYLVKQGQVSNQEYFIVNGQLVTLLESDSIIDELIDNNANCFSVKESVDNRKAMESTKTIKLSMTIFQSNYQSGKLIGSYKNEPANDFIKNFYNEYKFTSSGKITSN